MFGNSKTGYGEKSVKVALYPRPFSCFQLHRDIALVNEQTNLLQCNQVLEGSSEWNECHEEAMHFVLALS